MSAATPEIPERAPTRVFGPRFAPIVLVGEAPSRRQARAHHALWRKDLRDLLGVDELDYFRRFARTNVLTEWPGRARSGKGDVFPVAEARRQAGLLRVLLRARRPAGVVLLGRRVERAFDLRRASWFGWRRDRDLGWVAVAPHPSRVSSWWNDEGNRLLARGFWAQVSEIASRRLNEAAEASSSAVVGSLRGGRRDGEHD